MAQVGCGVVGTGLGLYTCKFGKGVNDNIFDVDEKTLMHDIYLKSNATMMVAADAKTAQCDPALPAELPPSIIDASFCVGASLGVGVGAIVVPSQLLAMKNSTTSSPWLQPSTQQRWFHE